MNIGDTMYALCARLFPICRSITGNGVRETLRILQEIVPEMTIHEVSSGTKVFDWTVPKEWNIRERGENPRFSRDEPSCYGLFRSCK